jgi:hypothetical protein
MSCNIGTKIIAAAYAAMTGQTATAVLLVAALVLVAPARAENWRTYTDEHRQYRLELPLTSFHVTRTEPQHLSFSEVGGDGVIDVYAGQNLKHLSPNAFADKVSAAGEIKDITYRAGGRNWFVLSGHYTGDGLIYYAKYIFSPDLSAVAGFEISYAVAEKSRMDPIVDRLEASFRRPQ